MSAVSNCEIPACSCTLISIMVLFFTEMELIWILFQVLSLMEDRRSSGCHGGRLRTLLKGLDEALGGGIPPGLLTELVGPSGIGKTQVGQTIPRFCFVDLLYD